MKKRKNRRFGKIGFVILTVSLLLSMLAVLVYANEEYVPLTDHTSYVKEYFNWIHGDRNCNGIKDHTSLYPQNVNGSCGQVAASLMLSFYDAYWDDNIVRSDHEYFGGIDEPSREIWKSNHINLENSEWATYWENCLEAYRIEHNVDSLSEEEEDALENSLYCDFLTENSYYFLHTSLIALGKENGYYEDYSDCGINVLQLKELLTDYLSMRGLSSARIEVHSLSEGLFTDRDDLFQTAKSIINQGFPVIYRGDKIDSANTKNRSSNDKEKAGHFLLGYMLTNGENDIALTPCWNNNDLQTFYTTEYFHNASIIWLEIKDSYKHNCSVSYKHSSYSEEKYCVCEIFEGHTNHECKLIETRQPPCPLSQSREYCLCGQQINGYHSFNYYNENSPIYHLNKCACGYEYKEEHTFRDVYNQQEEKHYHICNCGYKTEEHHFVSYRQYLSLDPNDSMRNSYHIATCECGDEELLPHSFIITITQSVCRDCGFTRPHIGPGCNIIMGKKEDEEDE